MAFQKNVHSVSVEIGGRDITFETGWVAKQASGAVIVKQDDSAVLVTAVGGQSDKPFDFLPLTVDYVSRTAASGKIPGGFLKREGRPDERGTLICRLIDRPIRPQFPKHWRKELQIIATVLSYDNASDVDVLSMCGASAAAHISDLPLQEPVAAVRVVRHEGEFKINPSNEELHASDIHLIVAGTADAICMVEGGAAEADESSMIDAMDLAHENIKKIIGAINELQAKAGKIPTPPLCDYLETIGHTPLVKLGKCLPKECKAARVLAKLEMCNPGGSLKDRIAKKGSKPKSGNQGNKAAKTGNVGKNVIMCLRNRFK